MIKILFNTIGTLAVILAILGIFLPLLPTTPFLLLASACYMRGSDRLHSWLLNNKVFGPYLANLHNGCGITMRSKITALIFLWASLAFSAWLINISWLRLFLLIPGFGVTIYLLKTKTLTKKPTQPSDASD